jgi:hypothetical protein
MKTIIAIALTFALSTLSPASRGDACRLETDDEVQLTGKLVAPGVTLVRLCWFCDVQNPVPVRVRRVDFKHTEPSTVRAIAWAGGPVEKEFPVEALEQAERDGTGELAAFIRADVEKSNADTTGYLGPNDPYLVQEKQGQYELGLRNVREDHDMRSWDELVINEEPADPRLLYARNDSGVYQSIGYRVGCLMDGAPHTVAFAPVERDTGKVPPQPYVADVTGQCYDGACPLDTWVAVAETPLLSKPGEGADVIARLHTGEHVTPVRTETHVSATRLDVVRDHEQFFSGDVAWLLDSQAEGFFRIWHYGNIDVIDATGVDLGQGWQSCSQEPKGCWARGRGQPRETWWSKVRRTDGVEGWIRDPIQKLDGVLRSD